MAQHHSPEIIEWVSQFLVMIDEGSVFRLIVLSGSLMWIGDKVVHQRPRAIHRGNVTGVSAMLFYWIYGWYRFVDFTPGSLLFITWRGILVGTLTLGPAWILFSIVDHLTINVFRPMLWRVRQHRFDFLAAWQARREQIRRKAEEENSRREFEATRAEREQQEREEFEIREKVRKRHERLNQEQRRITLDLTLLYNKHRKELKKRLPAAEFKILCQQLGDEKTVAEIRKRAEAIRSCIEDIVAQSTDRNLSESGGSTLDRLGQVADEMEEIEKGLSRFDDETRETLESILYEAKAQKLGKLISE